MSARQRRGPIRKGKPPQTDPEEVDVVPGQPIRYQAAGVDLHIPQDAVPQKRQLRLRLSVRNPQRPEVDIDVVGSSGLEFLSPVTLTMSYEGFEVDPDEKYHIYLLGPDREFIEDLGGFDDKNNKTVTAYIQHLSGYAVAGGRAEII